MGNKIKIILALAAFALLLLLAVIGYGRLAKTVKPGASGKQASAASSRGASAGSPDTTAASAALSSQAAEEAAPDFTVQDIDGKTVSFSDFRGKPIVLNFWASWCPPCRAEMPDYEKMYRLYSAKGVVFLMVNLTDGDRETVASAKQFLMQNKYTFSAYFDVKSEAADAYGISSIPESVFINKSGAIVNTNLGMMDADSMRQNIEAILK